MRINKFKVNNFDTVQVYLSEDEFNNNAIQVKLEEFKKQYKSIGIFVSGKDDFKNTVEKILLDFRNSFNLG